MCTIYDATAKPPAKGNTGMDYRELPADIKMSQYNSEPT